MDDALFSLLSSLNIKFELFEHAAVFSSQEAHRLEMDLPGVANKNLFLRNEKRTRYFMVTVAAAKRVDLKALGKQLGVKGLTFASAEDMERLIGISPGSVSLLALINDCEGKIEVHLDKDVWDGGFIQAHPLRNTATVVFSSADLERFCASTGHDLGRLLIPERV
jgi:Ala-tRNA(Pro) deacylase